MGGVYSSTCGNGIGVCCFVIQISGGEESRVTRNNTYIRSPGFPGTTTTSATYSHTIRPISSSICQIRFDFDTFEIGGPTTTGTPLGDCLTDTMAIREVSEMSVVRASLIYFYLRVWTEQEPTASIPRYSVE